MSTIAWLQQWYIAQCDDEWEHEYGIKIETMDNPGWLIKIDLKYTNMEDVRIKTSTTNSSHDDWYTIEIVDSVFTGLSSFNNLEILLKKFKFLAEFGEKEFMIIHPEAQNIPLSEGYSLNKGLPKPIREKIESIIDLENITSYNMHEKGEYIAESIRHELESITETKIDDINQLILKVYDYSWGYIRSKT